MVEHNQVQFLENDLRIKEDLSFLRALYAESCGVRLTGLLLNFRQLRSFLMGQLPEMLFSDFALNDGDDDDRAQYSNQIRALHAWCHASRKVFTVTDELKALLLGMGFGDLEWNDLVFPYDSFVLTLETPISVVHEGEQVSGDKLLISWLREAQASRPVLSVRLFSDGLTPYRFLSEIEKMHLNRKRRQKQKIAKILGLLITRVADHSSFDLIIAEGHFRELKIADTGELLSARMGTENDYSSIFRLIASFCFYLQTLPSGSPHRSQWIGVRSPGRPDPKAITNGADICLVTSSVTLTAEERRAFGGEGQPTGRELSAQVRRGHFRRAPGTGHDPTAPKVVLVRPYMIRRDRLQPGELVGGVRIKVKTR